MGGNSSSSDATSSKSIIIFLLKELQLWPKCDPDYKQLKWVVGSAASETEGGALSSEESSEKRSYSSALKGASWGCLVFASWLPLHRFSEHVQLGGHIGSALVSPRRSWKVLKLLGFVPPWPKFKIHRRKCMLVLSVWILLFLCCRYSVYKPHLLYSDCVFICSSIPYLLWFTPHMHPRPPVWVTNQHHWTWDVLTVLSHLSPPASHVSERRMSQPRSTSTSTNRSAASPLLSLISASVHHCLQRCGSKRLWITDELPFDA